MAPLRNCPRDYTTWCAREICTPATCGTLFSLGATGRGDLPSRSIHASRWSTHNGNTQYEIDMMANYLKNDDDEDCCASNNDCATCQYLEQCYTRTKKDNEKKTSPCVGCRIHNGYPCIHYSMSNTKCANQNQTCETTDMLDAMDDAAKQVEGITMTTICPKQHECLHFYQHTRPMGEMLTCDYWGVLTQLCSNGHIKKLGKDEVKPKKTICEITHSCDECIMDEDGNCGHGWIKEDNQMIMNPNKCGICADHLHNARNWLCDDCQLKTMKSYEQTKLDNRERKAYHNDLKNVGKWSVIISAIAGGLWYGAPVALKWIHKFGHWVSAKIGDGLHGINDATVTMKNFGIPYPMQAIMLLVIVLGSAGAFLTWLDKRYGYYVRDD